MDQASRIEAERFMASVESRDRKRSALSWHWLPGVSAAVGWLAIAVYGLAKAWELGDWVLGIAALGSISIAANAAAGAIPPTEES